MVNEKSISTNITDALKLIAKNLEHEDVNWVIVTSCALALQGLDIEPEDIDIMTDECGFLKINRVLDNYKISLSDCIPSTILDSTMSKFCVDNCFVEVISNFKIKSRTDNMWHDMSNLLKYRNMVGIGDMTLPVLPLLQLLEMYKLMSRDKDMNKIAKIEQYLIKN